MTQLEDIEGMQIGPDPDKLLVYHRQQLSAMLDGELSPDQAKFMLRRLQHDGELAACWERWQVCGDMLRGTHHALLPSDFAARVSRRIDAGAATDAVAGASIDAAATSRRRWRWGGGAAVAASVALLAVFAARQLPAPAVDTPGQGALAQGGAVLPAGVGGDGTDDAGAVAVASSVNGDVASAALAVPDEAVPDPVDMAGVALATAVAAAEMPRRNAPRRDRVARQPRVAPTVRADAGGQGLVPAATQLVAAGDVGVGVPGTQVGVVRDQALIPGNALASRPWPRAAFPSGDRAFSVTYGGLPVVTRQAGDYDPFLPEFPLLPMPVRAADQAAPTEMRQ